MSAQDRFSKLNRIWNYLYAQFEDSPYYTADFDALAHALQIVYDAANSTWKEVVADGGTGRYYRNS